MKITVIGASAGVGLEVVRELVTRGHSVTTLSRSIGSIPDDPLVTKVQGSSMSESDVAKAIDGAETILVTLGTGMSTKATGLYPNSSHVLLKALEALPNKPPLIVLTGFGAGESWGYNSFIMKRLFQLFLKDVYAEKTQMEQILSMGYPNSMFVRPGRLTNGEQRKKYRVIPELSRSMSVGAVSRKDVAHFMADQAEKPAYIGKYPALCY